MGASVGLDEGGILCSVAISSKMLAVLQKVEAAREQHFAELRASAKREAEAKARAKSLAKARRRAPTSPD